MGFIERMLGFAPDNGDGSGLVLWLIVLVLLVITVAYFRVQKKRR